LSGGDTAVVKAEFAGPLLDLLLHGAAGRGQAA
jgi:hypothetical protein